MIQEGRKLVKIHRNVVSSAADADGIMATKALPRKHPRQCYALLFRQPALIAAKAGAYIISPFVGGSTTSVGPAWT